MTIREVKCPLQILSLQKLIQIFGIPFRCVVSIKMCGAYYAEEEDGVGADCCKTKWIPFAVIDKDQ